MSDETNQNRLVMTVPEAGALLGIKPAHAYTAARNGQIPTIKIGRLLRVPIAAMNRMLQRAEKEQVE